MKLASFKIIMELKLLNKLLKKVEIERIVKRDVAYEEPGSR